MTNKFAVSLLLVLCLCAGVVLAQPPAPAPRPLLRMGDKTAGMQPAWYAAADQIEAALSDVDVVDVHLDGDTLVAALIVRADDPDAVRAAIEQAWRALLDASDAAVVRVERLDPRLVSTLDRGTSIIAFIAATAEIDRAAARDYLAQARSMTTFLDAVAAGTIRYAAFDMTRLYSGTPNHPTFLLPKP